MDTSMKYLIQETGYKKRVKLNFLKEIQIKFARDEQTN